MFINNLSKDETEANLSDIYSKFGKLLSVRVVTLRSGLSKGIAYVEFADKVRWVSRSNELRGFEMQVE